jgi:putative ABC transport system substrate-binding protein
MRRRAFIAGLGAAASSAIWPHPAGAQQPALSVVGYLTSGSPSDSSSVVAEFLRSLAAAGYVEGRNTAIEYRWAEGHNDRLPALAADLVRRQVAVIVARGIPATQAAKAATGAIPIVFVIGGDPVKLGLVASLNRPGGNLTGVSVLTDETTAKRLELLHEMVPAADLIGVLINPANSGTEAQARILQAAAHVLHVRLLILNASSESEIEAAFATLVRERAAALLVTIDTFFISHQDQIIGLAARHAVPTIEQSREFTAAGGLMGYGTNFQDSSRLLGTYASRILMGDKPGDLPVQQATRVELILNLKTAKALGLDVPTALLVRADEVIE